MMLPQVSLSLLEIFIQHRAIFVGPTMLHDVGFV
jgi:hypothetical protein